ncbi:MAG TPA: GNAT family N-acetyltransferase [Nocardioides sp.]|uniref:GNAT family N-acetyltransferase n=1 Tax=Nocardioides sp. TaxID=35761 RepID=UPI002CBC4734|nr:GNAT family N-acetyltransferase [Nocardioides sp.]HQR27245.1 GNAT family N-acetyltransferase [Nocardioides sp.]
MDAVRAGLAVDCARDPEAVERILRALPGWFQSEEVVAELVVDAGRLDSYLVRAGSRTVGVGLVDRRFASTVELVLLAVDPAWQDRGVGTLLLGRIESDLRADRVRVLEVHTLGPTCHDECYERTRAFYAARGFTPLAGRVASWSGPGLLLVKEL